MEKENEGFVVYVNEDVMKQGEIIEDVHSTEEQGQFSLDMPQPIGFLKCPNIQIEIGVYRKFNWFQKRCIKFCFGFEYTDI